MKKELYTTYIVDNDTVCEVRAFTETNEHGVTHEPNKEHPEILRQGLIDASNRTLTLVKKYGEAIADVKIKNANTDKSLRDEEWTKFPVVELKDFSELE